MGANTQYTVTYKVVGEKETHISHTLEISEIVRSSTTSGMRTWRGIAIIGGQRIPALSYGEVPVIWNLIHMVEPVHMLIQQLSDDLDRAYMTQEPDHVIKHIKNARRRIRRFKHNE